MMCFRRGFPFVGLVMFLVLAGAIVALAALTTWWVLFALVPLVMMGGCMAMMGATARVAGGSPRAWPSACCGMSPGRDQPSSNRY